MRTQVDKELGAGRDTAETSVVFVSVEGLDDLLGSPLRSRLKSSDSNLWFTDEKPQNPMGDGTESGNSPGWERQSGTGGTSDPTPDRRLPLLVDGGEREPGPFPGSNLGDDPSIDTEDPRPLEEPKPSRTTYSSTSPLSVSVPPSSHRVLLL